MKEDLDKINDKLDKVSEDIVSINNTLIRQEASLSEHMRRSLANEKAVDILKDELKPVATHVLQVQAIGMFLLKLGAAAAAVLAVKQLFF